MKALLFCLQEGWASLRRNPAASLAAITALSAVLFVLLLFLLLSRNVLMLAGRLEERKGLTVFLDPDTTPERRAELEAHFRGFPEVKDLRFLSRDQALEDIEGDLETSGIATVLDGNPLPDAFLLYPVPSAGQAASLTRLADEIRAYPGVEDVIYGERWVQALDRGLAAVRRGNLVTGALATIAIMLVLANTLRLLVLMREDQLSVMQLIGATNAYLRTPFLAAGVLLCLAGALVSQALLYAGFLASRSFLPGLRFLSSEWLIAFLAGVLVVGAVGSFATVEASLRSLERNREEAGA
ncbi:MAG: ABC transporter permease [Candidatus Eisenbacteria bacterium]|nr:ABC transporter permease [Candidatus Eisenbacteria bacterium]